jgi:hypothetical protein
MRSTCAPTEFGKHQMLCRIPLPLKEAGDSSGVMLKSGSTYRPACLYSKDAFRVAMRNPLFVGGAHRQLFQE